MPLSVSLILLSYNQENYIKLAVESALSQDYSHLEIIIADDASSDSTVDVVRDVADFYRGHHKIKIVANTTNKGTFANFQSGIQVATGDLILCGAGDDILEPSRVSVMAAAWENTSATALHSAYDTMDENGILLERSQIPNAGGHPVFEYIRDNNERNFVNGATAAYDGNFLRSLPLTKKRIFHEDSVLTLIVHALGMAVCLVPIVTIRYRVHVASFSNNTALPRSPREFLEMEKSLARFAESSLAYLTYFKDEWLDDRPDKREILDRINLRAIDNAMRSMNRTIKQVNGNFLERLFLTIRSRNIAEFRAAFSRIAGLSIFGHFKALRMSISSRR